MFSNLLVATDLSLPSHHVVCASASLKQLGAKKAVLLYCFKYPLDDSGMLAAQVMKSIEPEFNSQKKVLVDKGFEVLGRMIPVASYFAINNEADTEDCSLIVIGSAGQTMSKATRLGGVASAVIHSATRPVLIFRVKFAEDGGKTVCKECSFDMLEHILFPTDFSSTSERAYTYVQKMADCGAKQITLMHVQDKVKLDGKTEKDIAEFNAIDIGRLERLKTDLGKRGVKNVSIVMPYGLPKQEIVDYTHRNNISLVVMGSQGRGYVKEFFLGSVSHTAARYSDSSVLLIPPLR
ncbi:MAG: universal stress protein [Phycisphaerae bacterium]|jgi:nucleotide-binding universal stress UspA family protein